MVFYFHVAFILSFVIESFCKVRGVINILIKCPSCIWETLPVIWHVFIQLSSFAAFEVFYQNDTKMGLKFLLIKFGGKNPILLF